MDVSCGEQVRGKGRRKAFLVKPTASEGRSLAPCVYGSELTDRDGKTTRCCSIAERTLDTRQLALERSFHLGDLEP